MVEAHGTGTLLGDPVEIGAVATVISTSKACVILALKGNLGHMESTAGISGVLRILIGLREYHVGRNV